MQEENKGEVKRAASGALGYTILSGCDRDSFPPSSNSRV